ncbi:hypothetical protein [Limnobaculum xujianqingii]|nr:hypothetical protein [Limnobaculum xujianqingii]
MKDVIDILLAVIGLGVGIGFGGYLGVIAAIYWIRFGVWVGKKVAGLIVK